MTIQLAHRAILPRRSRSGHVRYLLTICLAVPFAHPAAIGFEVGAESPAFMESVQCAICHANSSRAVAMRDAAGQPIAPFDLWRSSAMANASRDPFWRAVLSAEIAATPSQRSMIEATCSRCHAPMATRSSASERELNFAQLDRDDPHGWLGIDGVSCTVCHQIDSAGLGTPATFTGRFLIGAKGPLFGPHLDPFTPPMQHHTGYTPTYAQHMLDSGLCATCHTLDTDAVSPDGTAVGLQLHEQSPYREWRNSVYNTDAAVATDHAQSCQECHLPRTEPDGQLVRTPIAHNPGGRDFPFLQSRNPFGRHTFLGGNLMLTQLLMDHRETLAVAAPRTALAERLAAGEQFLARRSAKLTLGHVTRNGNELTIPVTVTNLAGHKLPTAYPSRRVWLHVEVRNDHGDLVFGSGAYNSAGHLVNAAQAELASEEVGGPILPHFEVIRSEDQVQVYESLMADSHGHPTCRLLRGASYMKDNRLLPRGWRPTHDDAHATRPVGTQDDDDFQAGSDTLVYAIPLSAVGPLTVEVWLHYQVLAGRFANELFAIQTPQVQTFRELYAQTAPQPTTLAQLQTKIP